MYGTVSQGDRVRTRVPHAPSRAKALPPPNEAGMPVPPKGHGVTPSPPGTGAQKARQFTLVSWDVSLRSPEQPCTKQSFPEAARLQGSPGHTYGPRGVAQRGSPFPTEAQVTASVDQADVRETGLPRMIPGPGRPNPSETPPAPRVP